MNRELLVPEDPKRIYKASKRRSLLLTLAVAAVCILAAVYSLGINAYDMTFSEAWNVFIDHLRNGRPERIVGDHESYVTWLTDYVVVYSNASRIAAAAAVGVILSVGGSVMQTVTHNPLTEPYTIGISSAALLGYSIAMVYGVCILPFASRDAAEIINAFVFSLIPASVILFISIFRKMTPMMMVLIGIGMMYLFSAFSTFVRFNASEEDLKTIYDWTVGSVGSVTWDQTVVLLIAAAVLAILFVFVSGSVNVLAAGDDEAHGLGLNAVLFRVFCFLAISVAVAIAVCYTGTIGFVGLVAPHIARIFTGNDNRLLIPAAAAVGALMIIAGDTLVRWLPGGLPVGVITAIIGSPLFLYFLYRQRKNSLF